MNPDFFELYECRHLHDDDVERLKGFTVRDGGGNLANYLSTRAFYDEQEQIFVYSPQNFCNGNPYKPKDAEEIYSELAESRAAYERGEYEDFDDALGDISEEYGL